MCILDWESWRPMFAGYDLATLYCNSLLHPATGRRIRDMPELHTHSGNLALLSAICRYLWIVGEGSDWDPLSSGANSICSTPCGSTNSSTTRIDPTRASLTPDPYTRSHTDGIFGKHRVV